MYWDNYSLIYTGTFDSIGNQVQPSISYTIELYKKGILIPPSAQSLIFAKDPCIISYLDDSATNSIKGMEITINLLNIDNQLPLSTFYSDSDDEWKIKLYINNPTITGIQSIEEFEGFLIQDSCQEIQTDITHEITLRFTDGLGLLKNIKFDQAFKLTSNNLTLPRFSTRTQISAILDSVPISQVYPVVNTNLACFLIFNATGLNIQKYDTLYIKVRSNDINLTCYNGIYTINRVDSLGNNRFRVYVDEPITRLQDAAINADICVITPEDINNKCSLIHILKCCLQNTNTKLTTCISNQLLINDDTGDHDNIFEYVYIDPNSFSSNGKYISTYDVLENILERFNFTIFQGFYRWNIFRFYEMRFISSFSGYEYNYNFTQSIPVTNLNGNITIGDLTDIEYGIINTIERPQSYILDTYAFQQRDQLITNGDLLETDGPKGNFLFYPGDSVIYRAWHPKYWSRPDGSLPANAYILDQYIQESNFVDYNRFTRYINVDKISVLNDVDPYYLRSSPIEVNAGDEISISFSFSVDAYFQDGRLAIKFPVQLLSGISPITTYYLTNRLGPDEDISGFTTDVKLFLFDTKTVDRIFSVNMRANAPVDGNLYIYLPRGIDQTLSDPAGFVVNPYIGYKDFDISITPFIVGNATAKNQYNKVSGNLSLRNKIEIDSYLADAPRNFMQGCLYTGYNDNNGIRIKTKDWKENSSSEYKTIQRITSAQKMVLYYKNRKKYEGKYLAAISQYTFKSQTFYRILNPTLFVDNLLLPNAKNIFGKMDINLRENSTDFTLYEFFSDNDPSDNIDDVFNNLFTYTYNTK